MCGWAILLGKDISDTKPMRPEVSFSRKTKPASGGNLLMA
jgi:hypothetical protein